MLIKVKREYNPLDGRGSDKTVASKTTVFILGIRVYTKIVKPNKELLRDGR